MKLLFQAAESAKKNVEKYIALNNQYKYILKQMILAFAIVRQKRSCCQSYTLYSIYKDKEYKATS